MSLTSEFRDLVEQAKTWQSLGLKSVLATVVRLDGSSYRRPGVRMVINENHQMAGAVSGGCVEKEVLKQAQGVFDEGIPKMMTYDGRFRLGCEGVVFILIEPLFLTTEFLVQFERSLQAREDIECTVQYSSDIDQVERPHEMGTCFSFKSGEQHYLRPQLGPSSDSGHESFRQTLAPIFQLFIFGVEHDAVVMSEMASKLGWDVHVVGALTGGMLADHFKGAKSISLDIESAFKLTKVDAQSAVLLMTHSLNKDVQYLWALRSLAPLYIGILGPAHRRERILNELFNLYPEANYDFFDLARSPAGIDLGAESPAEIAISIISEILSVKNEVELKPLHLKMGKIHE